MLSVPIVCDSSFVEPAQLLAAALGQSLLLNQELSQITHSEFVLCFDHKGLALQQTGHKAPGPIRVDFTEGAVDHRRKFGGGKGQMIAKAVGMKAGVYPQVLDATAGLGKDSFVLATQGCRLTMIERSPIVNALLQDGLTRALTVARAEDPQLLAILNRMSLVAGDSLQYLASLSADQLPDVIYLDPMFPERQKSADVKKEMKAFHDLVGADQDADSLLPLALAHVNYRVVVKRPRKAPFLNNQTPSYQLEGKSSRYDIYTLKKMPERLHAQD